MNAPNPFRPDGDGKVAVLRASFAGMTAAQVRAWRDAQTAGTTFTDQRTGVVLTLEDIDAFAVVLDAEKAVAPDAPDYLKSATPPQLASYVGRAHADVATAAHTELVSRGWEPLAAPPVEGCENMLTVLTAASTEQRKTWKADGSVEADGADETFFAIRQVDAGKTLEDLAAILSQLAQAPHNVIVHGAPKPGLVLAYRDQTTGEVFPVHRRRLSDAAKHGEDAVTIVDRRSLHFVADVDDPVLSIAEAILRFPAELQASHVAQLSSKAGHPSTGGKLVAHLIFKLDRALTAAEMRVWTKDLASKCAPSATGKAVIDPGVYKAVQPIYIAPPRMEPGAPTDPFAGSRIFVHRAPGLPDTVKVPAAIGAASDPTGVAAAGVVSIDAGFEASAVQSFVKAAKHPQLWSLIVEATDEHLAASLDPAKATAALAKHYGNNCGNYSHACGLIVAPVARASQMAGIPFATRFAAVEDAAVAFGDMATSIGHSRENSRNSFKNGALNTRLRYQDGSAALTFLRSVVAKMGLAEQIFDSVVLDAMPIGTTGAGPQASGFGIGTGGPAVNAEGMLDVPPLPDFAECPALAEVVAVASGYGVDPAIALGVCIGAAGNLIGAKFDVEAVNGGEPVGTNLTTIGFQKSGGGKTTTMKTLLGGVRKALLNSATLMQSRYALFIARHAAYARECEKQKSAPLPMNALKPVRVEEDDFTPQSLQRVLYVNAPPVLIPTDEASTMFEVAERDMRVALANTFISIVDGVVKKSVRIGEAKAAGTTVSKASSAAIETEADATSRVSVVGLTQNGTWKSRVLGRGMLDYLETRGAMARMLLVLAVTGLSASERIRKTTAPGSGPSSPFKLWEMTASKLAAGIEMYIERTSLYGRQVGEEPVQTFPWETAGLPVMPAVSVPEDFESSGARVLGAIDGTTAPKVPRGIMLGGDSMRRIKLRMSEGDRARLKEHCAVFMEQAERGMLGPRNDALDALVARIPDKVAQVAAALHGLNKADHLIAVRWDTHNPDDPELFIPANTLDLAFRFVEHATVNALTYGFYGHRVLGKETNAEKREREFHSPTVESEQSAAKQSAEAVVLGKLAKVGSTGATVRDVWLKLSKKQRLKMPDAEAVRAVLDGLVATGRAEATGETYRATAIRAAAGGED